MAHFLALALFVGCLLGFLVWVLATFSDFLDDLRGLLWEEE